MAKTDNFDDLKRLHDLARIKPAGSREWMEFATTMMDSWPAIYEKAKALNAEFYRLRNQVATGKYVVQRGVELMPLDSLSQWEGVRAFLERTTDTYPAEPITHP